MSKQELPSFTPIDASSNLPPNGSHLQPAEALVATMQLERNPEIQSVPTTSTNGILDEPASLSATEQISPPPTSTQASNEQLPISRTIKRLTPLQRDLLNLVNEGLTDTQIARQRGTDRSTVQASISKLINTIGVTMRAELRGITVDEDNDQPAASAQPAPPRQTKKTTPERDLLQGNIPFEPDENELHRLLSAGPRTIYEIADCFCNGNLVEARDLLIRLTMKCIKGDSMKALTRYDTIDDTMMVPRGFVVVFLERQVPPTSYKQRSNKK